MSDNIEKPKELLEKGYKAPERAAINKLSDSARKLELISGPGIILERTINGTVVRVDPQFTTRGTSGAPRWL